MIIELMSAMTFYALGAFALGYWLGSTRNGDV